MSESLQEMETVSREKTGGDTLQVTALRTSLKESWTVAHLSGLNTLMGFAFGMIWVIDGALKFQPGMLSTFSSMMEDVVTGQPAWLVAWFQFWRSLTLSNPPLFVYGQGVVEIALGAALVLGVYRKLAYVGGFLVSLLIWAVPEGFGGPYGPGATDIGAGVIYALVFLLLMIMTAIDDRNRHRQDKQILSRLPR